MVGKWIKHIILAALALCLMSWGGLQIYAML